MYTEGKLDSRNYVILIGHVSTHTLMFSVTQKTVFQLDALKQLTWSAETQTYSKTNHCFKTGFILTKPGNKFQTCFYIRIILEAENTLLGC